MVLFFLAASAFYFAAASGTGAGRRKFRKDSLSAVAGGDQGRTGSSIAHVLQCCGRENELPHNSSRAPAAFLRNLKIITPAVSFGGVETIICRPADTSHSKVSAEERKRIGISHSLLRLSVGIENVEDLLEDIEQALR